MINKELPELPVGDPPTSGFLYLFVYITPTGTGYRALDLPHRIDHGAQIDAIADVIAADLEVDTLVPINVQLLSEPDDRTDEWRRTMNIYGRACKAAAAWSAVPRSDRTFIGDQLGHHDLTYALDTLRQAVADA